MKRIYATPSIIVAGDVVKETKGGSAAPPDSSGSQQTFAPGGVGFNL